MLIMDQLVHNCKTRGKMTETAVAGRLKWDIWVMQRPDSSALKFLIPLVRHDCTHAFGCKHQCHSLRIPGELPTPVGINLPFLKHALTGGDHNCEDCFSTGSLIAPKAAALGVLAGRSLDIVCDFNNVTVGQISTEVTTLGVRLSAIQQS